MGPRDRSEVGWEESDGNVFHPFSESFIHSSIFIQPFILSFLPSSAILPRIRVRDCIVSTVAVVMAGGACWSSPMPSSRKFSLHSPLNCCCSFFDFISIHSLNCH